MRTVWHPAETVSACGHQLRMEIAHISWSMLLVGVCNPFNCSRDKDYKYRIQEKEQ